MRIAALAFAGIADAATGYADLEMTTYGSSSYNGIKLVYYGLGTAVINSIQALMAF